MSEESTTTHNVRLYEEDKWLFDISLPTSPDSIQDLLGLSGTITKYLDQENNPIPSNTTLEHGAYRFVKIQNEFDGGEDLNLKVILTTTAQGRLSELVRCELITTDKTTDASDEWNPEDPNANNNGSRYITLNRSELTRCIAKSLIDYCRIDSKGSLSLSITDVWCILKQDLLILGFTPETNTNPDRQQWLYHPTHECAVRGMTWQQKDFTEFVTSEPLVETYESRESMPHRPPPKSISIHPPITTRFGGGYHIVNGNWFSRKTSIVLDNPYGGSNSSGWYEPVEPLSVNNTTAIMEIIPMITSNLRQQQTRVAVYTTDRQLETDELGDAILHYETGDKEAKQMKELLLQLILSCEDYDDCQFCSLPTPMLSGLPMSSAERSAALEMLTPDSFINYLSVRKGKGLLHPFIRSRDLYGRNVIHYISYLKWDDVFNYCRGNAGFTASLSDKDNWDFMPIHFSIASGSFSMVEQVAKEMSEVSKRQSLGKTAALEDIYAMTPSQYVLLFVLFL